VVRELRHIATRASVSFEVLLELAANNDFSRLGDNAPTCEVICDLVDDELLALEGDPVVNPAAEDPAIWIERVFRDSLAAIQARSGILETGTEDVLAFLHARAESALRRVPPSERKAIVSSGLPLAVALRTQSSLAIFRAVADTFRAAEGALPALVTAVREIEEWARQNATSVTGEMPDVAKLDAMREGWLGGVGLLALSAIDDEAKDISRELYGYQLPWIIHAASQQLRGASEPDRADTLATIALLVELGVPTDLAARIFLAGVRSRAAATELAMLGDIFGRSVSAIRRSLRSFEFASELLPLVSVGTADWLNLMVEGAARERPEAVPDFPAFTLRGGDHVEVLHARRLGDHIFLCTPEGGTQFRVDPTDELPFDTVANDPRVAFTRLGRIWKLTIRDPRLRGTSDE
jgi:hypothetical protein